MEDYIYTSYDVAIINTIETVQFDIKYRFMQEIERFYQDPVFRNGTSCIPVMYDRTGSLELAFKPYLKQEGRVYTFGGIIDGNNIPYTPYYSMFSDKPMSPRYVFDQFYYLGKHGADIIKTTTVDGKEHKEELWTAPTTRPTPSYAMTKWWNKEYKHTIKFILLQELRKAMAQNKTLLKKG